MVAIAIIALVAFASAAFAPAPADTLDTETLLVNLDESNENIAGLIERLEQLRHRLIDLNHCSADDLLELPFVSAAEASAIIEYRRVHGRYTSTQDLRAVAGLDGITYERMLHFVSVRLPMSAQPRTRLRADFTQRWTRRLERADGFRRDSSGYLGDPNVLQTRASLGFGKLSGRATLDKDAGEPMDWSARKYALGYDFMSGHLQLQDVGWIRRLVLGDFSPRFAHGVLLRPSGGFRAAAPAGRGGAASLRPYASAGESGYFRGIGIQIEPAEWIGLTAFVSRRRMDAGIDTTRNPDTAVFSRRTSGLHRTMTERAGRGLLQESSYGGAIQGTAGPVSISAALYASDEALALSPTEEVALRRRVSTYSLSAGAAIGPVYVAAELTPTAGFLAMVDVRSGTSGRFGLAVRRSRAAVYLPTSSLTGGSDGLTDAMTQVVVHGRHRLATNTGIDFAFEHELQRSPKDHAPFSTVRSHADILVTHKPMPWITIMLRGTDRRSADVRTCLQGTVRCLEPTTRQTLRFQLDYRHSRHIECRLRGEYVRATSQPDAPAFNSSLTFDASQASDAPSNSGASQAAGATSSFSASPASSASRTSDASRGVLVYQELRLRAGEALQIAGRLALFTADQHAARIYTYENDLSYAFSSPSFAGRGRRAYVLVRWKTSDAFTLEAKWSQTVRDDVRSIGSGRDEVQGGRQREIRIQIRIRLR